MGFVHFLFFSPFFFHFFYSFFFYFFFTLECSHPLFAFPGFIPSCWGHCSSWWGTVLLAENAALCWGLVWMLQPFLAQSNPLGDVGWDLLCRGESRGQPPALLTTKAKHSAHSWDKGAGVFSKCHWCFCTAVTGESGLPLHRIPWR